MTITVTCATIAAALASAQGGEAINLTRGSDCTGVVIARTYDRRVTINAGGSTLRGLVITGGNVRIYGGTYRATGGAFGFAGAGYGVLIHRGASRVTFDNVLVTDAKKGVVIDVASGITFTRSRFLRLGEDGIIASRVDGLTVTRSRFAETIGKPSECNVASVVSYAVASRDCLARGGVWRDGYHADAVQLRNGVINATISYNIVEGPTQGLTQMDTTGDLPLRNVTVHGNMIRTDGYHRLTLGNCIGCTISGNDVGRAPGSLLRAVIIPGMAQRCGNVVQDERVQDGPC